MHTVATTNDIDVGPSVTVVTAPASNELHAQAAVGASNAPIEAASNADEVIRLPICRLLDVCARVRKHTHTHSLSRTHTNTRSLLF